MGAELRGEFLDRHFVVAGPRNIPGPDRTPRAEPATLQQAPDHRRVEGLLLGWFPALDVQAIRNVLCGGIPPTHLGDARDQTVELLQLFEAPDRADQRVSGHDASCPMACEIRVFGGAQASGRATPDPGDQHAVSTEALVQRFPRYTFSTGFSSGESGRRQRMLEIAAHTPATSCAAIIYVTKEAGDGRGERTGRHR